MDPRASLHVQDHSRAISLRTATSADAQRPGAMTRWPGAATSPIMIALVATWFLLAAVFAVPLPGLHG